MDCEQCIQLKIKNTELQQQCDTWKEIAKTYQELARDYSKLQEPTYVMNGDIHLGKMIETMKGEYK